MSVYREYILFGRSVNSPFALRRVTDGLPKPTECRFCGATVELRNNASIYGQERGWPLVYVCTECGARVGCHPDTDIPLGTLADKKTMAARMAAHAAFDPIWRQKGPGARSKAYEALASALGRPHAHISHMDAKDCYDVVKLIKIGAFE